MRFPLVATALLLACSPFVQAGTARGASPAPGDAAALQFVGEVERTIRAGDPRVFDAALDVDGLLLRATAGLPAPDDVLAAMRDGARRNGISLGLGIVQATRVEGSYRFLRFTRDRGRLLATFRLLGRGAVNYHELALAVAPDGAVRVEDVYVFMNGEWLSATLHRAFLVALAGADADVAHRLGGTEGEYARSLELIGRMQEKHANGDDAGALAEWRALPPVLRRDKSLLLARVSFAAPLGAAPYADAIEAFRAAYPDDAALDLVSIDGAFLKGDTRAALATVDRLEKRIGPDPWLAHLRGNVLYAAHELGPAKQWFERALAAEPALAQPHWSLVTISLDERDYPETARQLARIESDLGVHVGDLGTNPAYAGFVGSSAYAQWSATR